MNKLFTKIAAVVLGATMAVGVGVAVVSKENAKQVDAGTTTDTINQSLTGLATSGSGGYTAWSNKTGSSGAKYSGQSNKGVSYLQIRGTSPSAIVTTTSGGKATRLTLTFIKSGNIETAQGRTVTIFGKNTAYSEPSDMYDNSKKGTQIGVFTKGASGTQTTTPIVVSGDYEYIGIISNGAAYISSITIDWTTGPVQLNAPSLTHNEDEAKIEWPAVTNASSYSYSYTESGTYTPTGNNGQDRFVDVSSLADNNPHTIYVKAVGDGTNYSTSNAASKTFTQHTKTVDHILIDSSSTHKTVFTVGDTFSYSGLVVKVNYEEEIPDETLTVTTDYTVSTPDLSTAGQKTVTITPTNNGKAKGAAAINYTIDVKELGDITVTGSASAKLGDESWTLSNIVITGTYVGGGSMGDITSDCTYTATTSVPNYLKRSYKVYLSVSYKGGTPITTKFVSGRVYDVEEVSEKIEFKDNGADSGDELTTSNATGQITDATIKYVSGTSAINKVYAGDGGLKIGSSNTRGYVTFSLSSQGQAIACKGALVKAKIKTYGTDSSSVKITIGNQNQTVSASSNWTEEEFFTINQDSVSSIRIDVTGKRGYVAYVSFSYSQEIDETYVTTLTVNDGSQDHTSDFNISINEQTQHAFTAHVDAAASDQNVTWTTSGNITSGSDGTYTFGKYSDGASATITVTSCGPKSSGQPAVVVISVTLIESTKTLDRIEWSQAGFNAIVGNNLSVSSLTSTITVYYEGQAEGESKALPAANLGLYSTASSSSFVKAISNGYTWTSTDNHFLGVSYTEGGKTEYAFSSTKMNMVTRLADVFEQEITHVYELVSDASKIVAGDVIVIASDYNNYALGATQNSNNRAAVAITKSDNRITWETSVALITVENGTSSGTLAFSTTAGYLYAASNSDNYLRSKESKDSDCNFTIEIEDNVANIVCQGQYSHNLMQFNNNNKLFSCYGDNLTNGDLAVYKQKDAYSPTQNNIANTDADQQKAVLDFIADYTSTVEGICLQSAGGTTDTNELKNAWNGTGTSGLTGRFATAAEAGQNFKDLFKYGLSDSESNDPLRKMLGSYNWIYEKYGSSLELTDFLHVTAGRPEAPSPYRVQPNSVLNSDNSGAIVTVVIVSVVSLTAIGGFFFLRKRREQ